MPVRWHWHMSPSRPVARPMSASGPPIWCCVAIPIAPIVEAVDIARRARRLVVQNFAFAALYNLAAIPLAAFGLVTPLIAAGAMAGSSLIVTLNALRLARVP